MLSELINATLTNRHLNKKVFEGVSDADWQQCYEMALAQNVMAMTFPAMSSLPKELRPSLMIWAQWMAYTQSIVEQTQYKRQVVEKMGAWLAEDGLSTLILKGFSLSALYPNPNLREFSDIDIFSGENYEDVNACLAKRGIKVSSVDGHHAYLKVDGVSVEHHFAFHNTKVNRGLKGPEETLQQFAAKDWRSTSVPGVCFPNPLFTALFVGWHAYEHFLQEKIKLRYIIDWVLALKQLSDAEGELLSEVKSQSRWGKFTDTMIATALNRLGFPQDWFPTKEIESARVITPEQEQRVWNDVIQAPHTPHSWSMNIRRISIAKRMLKNGWKYNDYADMSAKQYLWRNFIGHLKHLNIE